MHHKNIPELANEIFKVKNVLAIEMIKDIFVESNKNYCNLRN